MVGMKVGEKLHIDPADRYLELREPDGGAAASIDQEFPLARLDQRAGTEALEARDRRAGPEQCNAEVGRHELILIPASLMTLVQRTVSACRRAPNSSGVPPATSTPILARDS